MQIPIVLPELGAEDEPTRVSCWLIDLGDPVETGDRIVEVLTQGIAFDVSASSRGVLSHIEKPFDTTVSTGDVLGWIEQKAVESEE